MSKIIGKPENPNNNLRLTNNQCKVLLEYIKSGCNDLSGAVITAGYSGKVAANIASKLRSNKVFGEMVSFFTKESMQEGSGKSGSDILKELALVGFFDIKDIFVPDGEGIKLLNVLDMGQFSRGIKKIKHTQRTYYGDDGVINYVEDKYEYELWDKLQALRLLGDNLGLFKKEEAFNTTIIENGPRIYLPDNGKGKTRATVRLG
jgi:hypothetical protein